MSHGNRKYHFRDLANEYKEVGSTTELAKKYGCTRQTIEYNLKKMGVDTSRGFKKWDELVSDFNDGLSISRLSERYELSKNRISAKLRELGVEQTHDDKPLDMPIGLGRHGELLVLELLEGAVDNNLDNCNASGYDILFRGIKIDVKTSSLKVSKSTGKNGSWGFEMSSSGCDYYVLVGLNKKKKISSLFLIPYKDINQRTVTISAGKSKWDKYMVSKHELEEKLMGVSK